MIRPIPGFLSPKTNSYGNLGPRLQVSEPLPLSCILNSLPDWSDFQDAILDLENNRVYCSRNNSLLSFSAPDWLLLI